MRITEQHIVSNFLASISQTRERLVELQTQLATGKRVEKPSDDPRAAAMILRLTAGIDRNEQHARNAQDAEGLLDTTVNAFDAVSNLFTDVKDIVTRASNSANTDSLGAFADRIDQLLGEAVDMANTKFNGKYLFGGTNTIDPPFTLAADRSAVTANPNGITGAVRYELGEGSTQQVNIDGQEAFQGTQLFTLMIQLRDSMRTGQMPTLAQSNSVNAALDHLLAEGSKAGSILENVRTIQAQLDQQKTMLLSLRSNEQDTDVAEATLRLKQEEMALQAALNTGAQIIPKTLIDFLR